MAYFSFALCWIATLATTAWLVNTGSPWWAFLILLIGSSISVRRAKDSKETTNGDSSCLPLGGSGDGVADAGTGVGKDAPGAKRQSTLDCPMPAPITSISKALHYN